MNTKTRIKLITELRSLALGSTRPKRSSVGLCAEVRNDYTLSTRLAISKLTLGWPEHSGDPVFPVPHQSRGAEGAFRQIPDLWDIDTQIYEADKEYVRARKRLCWWLADQLTEEDKPLSLTKRIRGWFVTKTCNGGTPDVG